jgi:hypothetical protein
MSLTKVSYSMIQGSPANVLDYGAVADNATDSIVAIQAAIDNNDVIYVPYGTYLIATGITIPAGKTLLGPGSIHFTGVGQAISVTGDNVTIEGITVYGNYNNVFLSGSIGIYCNQTTFSPSLNVVITSNLIIKNCIIYNFGQSGIRGDWWNTFEISGCDISTCGQHGILITSPRYGKITNNTVFNITPGQTNSGYGISLSRNATVNIAGVPTNLTTTQAPVPFDCLISNNIVSAIDNYVGLDLHSGNNILISNNTVQSCQVGLNLEHASTTGNEATVNNVSVVGNVFYGSSSPRFAPAIIVDAQSGLGEIAKGITFTGNTFFQHGLDSSGPFEGINGGVIYLTYCEGVAIVGNTFQNPKGRAVSIHTNATNVSINNNVVQNLNAQDGIQVAFDLIAGSGQATINGNAIYATAGNAVASVTISTGKGIKVGADNIVYGGIEMGTAATLLRIRGGGFLMSARVMATWNAAGTLNYSAFENINYVNADITITKNGTGDFTVSWPAGIFEDSLVCAVFSGCDPASGAVFTSQVTSSNATSATCKTFNSSAVAIDCAENSLLVFGR